MVVGFMFCGAHVLLVQKRKPDWQKGLWNGVGGKCEDGELHQEAIVREVLEETGIGLPIPNWTHFATEVGPGYELFCYKAELAILPRVLPSILATNDVGEPLRWFLTGSTYALRQKLGNLNWLVPLAQDWRTFRGPVTINVYDDIKEKASW
jgi:8-oxo-dGTP diphosphatase